LRDIRLVWRIQSVATPITPEGFRRLQQEYERLRRVERPRVTHEVQLAAAQGDRSENAEYIYGKKRLREIDARLRFLARRMNALTVVSEQPVRSDRVFFGAWVTLEDEAGETRRYRLVGPDEFEVEAGRISVESPLGRALLGREEGDEVVVRRPKGTARFTLVAIEYEAG
jgi:transcription elongation factor GreB